MPRQANGTGSRPRWDAKRGQFEAQIRLNGKRRTLRDDDEAALVLKIQAARVDTARGLPLPSNKLTVRRYLQEWIDGARQDGERRSGTLRGYDVNVRHISGSSIGGVRLGELKPRHIQVLLRELRAKKLSENTVKYIHATLRVALGDAVELEELARNPAQVTRRKGRKRGAQQAKKRIVPLTGAQVDALRTATRDERLQALFLIAVACGLRRGELLGLRWADVDFERRQLHVRWQLGEVEDDDGARRLDFVLVKTDGSERTVDLSDEATQALIAHRDRQVFEAQAAMNLWQARDLVFCTEWGGGIETTTLYRIWDRVRTAAGLTARLHDLRHTTASLLLAAGVSPWDVSKILGHSSYQFTIDTYGHLFPETRREAAEAMNAVLTQAGSRTV